MLFISKILSYRSVKPNRQSNAKGDDPPNILKVQFQWRLKSCIRQQWDIFPQPFIAFNILKLVFYKSSDLEKDDLVIVPSLRLRNLTEFFVCQWFASFAVDKGLSTFQ